MAARRKAVSSDAPAIVVTGDVIEKAQIALPAPGSVRFAVLGTGLTEQQQKVISLTRRQLFSIYYEMFRQHPTIRAGIEKIAKVSVATGFQIVPETEGEDLNKAASAEVRDFLRRSSSTSLLRLTYKDLLIFGNAYWWVERARNGKPLRAKRLHPRFVDIKTDGADITAYRYGPDFQDIRAKNYPPQNILHFKLDDPDSDLYGLSLLDSLQHTVAVDLFALAFNGKFFENSAQTGTIFALKSTDASEVARNREYLEQNYVGTDNAHKPLLLEGDIDVKRSVSTPQEMQFLEGRKMLREEMLEVLDVPPDKLGIFADVNRSTSKESDNTFRSEAVTPLQSIVEEEFNNRIVLDMFGYSDILFKHKEVSRRDSLDQMKLLSESERMGVLSPNEIRADQFGLPPVEGGDQHFIQTAAGLIPLTMLDDVAKRLLPATASGAAPGVGPTGQPTGTPQADTPFRSTDPTAPSLGSLRG